MIARKGLRSHGSGKRADRGHWAFGRKRQEGSPQRQRTFRFPSERFRVRGIREPGRDMELLHSRSPAPEAHTREASLLRPRRDSTRELSFGGKRGSQSQISSYKRRRDSATQGHSRAQLSRLPEIRGWLHRDPAGVQEQRQFACVEQHPEGPAKADATEPPSCRVTISPQTL